MTLIGFHRFRVRPFTNRMGIILSTIMFTRFQGLITLLLVVLFTGCASDVEQTAQNSDNQLVVFAAASLQDVIREVGQAFEDSLSVNLTYNFAASNVLARQLVAAPKADIYISANEQWMDYVQDAGMLIDNSRHTILSNQLVVIGNRDVQWNVDRPEDLTSLDYRYLSLGNPEAVPAGRYAKAWLESISMDGVTLWSLLNDRVVPGPDVRAALGLVEAQSDIIGIVYRTDASVSEEVEILYRVPLEKGPPIRYTAAAVRGRSVRQTALRFLEFLESSEAKETFQKFGFISHTIRGELQND